MNNHHQFKTWVMILIMPVLKTHTWLFFIESFRIFHSAFQWRCNIILYLILPLKWQAFIIMIVFVVMSMPRAEANVLYTYIHTFNMLLFHLIIIFVIGGGGDDGGGSGSIGGWWMLVYFLSHYFRRAIYVRVHILSENYCASLTHSLIRLFTHIHL